MVSEKNPVVSIIIPVFNGAEYIQETVVSVTNQTFSNWELIITDDGSTDRTPEILAELAEKDLRIHIIRQVNGGMGNARNAAITHARGEFLAFIDADDLWAPDKLEKQVAAIRDTGADLIYTSGYLFKGTVRNVIEKWEVPAGLHGYQDFFTKQLFGFTVPVLSVLVKKEIVTDIGGFEESRKSHLAADYQLWLRIMDKHAMFYGINDCLFYYRIHEKQSTFNDTLALGPVLWSMKLARLSSISESLKLKVMMQRLDRYIVHHADSMNSGKLRELVKLYFQPLGRPLKGILMMFLAMVGKKALINFGYRFLDLSEKL